MARGDAHRPHSASPPSGELMDGDPTTATQRVVAALEAGRIPTRKDVEHSLREVWNISGVKARRFAAEGIKALGMTVESELLDLMKRLEVVIKKDTQ